jgi:K+-sensing histidine kinase KdpD
MQGMMRRATHRLGILVRALVDVDCLERGVMPCAPADVAWTSIVTPVVEAALAVAATKEIALVTRGDAGARLRCDSTLAERMLATLVEHAIANAPPKSVVEIDGTTRDPGFRLRVVHHGRAVGQTTLEKYFTTLPLRFCRLAAARHGATLRALSPVDDAGGLAFEIDLAG